jgi:hypothetical protein
VQIDKLYRCLDKLLPHKRDLFTYLRQRWQALFHVGFEVLLYDLTSTYFESEPPEGGLRKFGYSRDKRPDCVQVVIALIVTPEGFPLAYEVMPGNTLDKTSIEQQYKGPAHLGDGPGHSHRRDPQPNAHGRDAHSLSGGHAQGASEKSWKKNSSRSAGSRSVTQWRSN